MGALVTIDLRLENEIKKLETELSSAKPETRTTLHLAYATALSAIEITKALDQMKEAADKSAAQLNRWTSTLALATFALVAATVALVIVEAIGIFGSSH